MKTRQVLGMVAVLLMAMAAGLVLAGTARAQGANPPAPKASADKGPIVVPEEMREMLLDRQMILDEIERISNLSGEGLKIKTSQAELSRRAEAKWQRFLAWVDAQGIPRDKGLAQLALTEGWTVNDWTFRRPQNKVEESKGPRVEEKKP